ncbi:MAG: hypothetical protein L0211_24490 [Planctomycetaceae bacterium]|nr:hypothetical protein [Planctomycetaceae bacterium]
MSIRLGLLALGLMSLAAALLAGCHHESAASSPSAPVAAAPLAASHTPDLPAENLQPAAAADTEQVTAAGEAPSRPPPKDPASTRAPADRTPTRPGDAQKVTFDDLNLGMSQDMVFRPFLLTDRVKELDGARVRITGFIHAAAASSKRIEKFVLLKNTECKFGAGGQADHLAMVYLTKGQTTNYQLEAIKVEGTLVVKPYEGTDGNTWSVYDLTDAKVVP